MKYTQRISSCHCYCLFTAALQRNESTRFAHAHWTATPPPLFLSLSLARLVLLARRNQQAAARALCLAAPLLLRLEQSGR